MTITDSVKQKKPKHKLLEKYTIETVINSV